MRTEFARPIGAFMALNVLLFQTGQVFGQEIPYLSGARSRPMQIALDQEHRGRVRGLVVALDETLYAVGALDAQGFLAHIDPRGATVAWQPLSGPANRVGVDAQGALYIAGDNFLEKRDAALKTVYTTPLTEPASALAVRPDGTLLLAQGSQVVGYSVAGRPAAQFDFGTGASIRAIAIGSEGEVLIAGSTNSPWMPAGRNVSHGGGDAFVARMAPGETAAEWSIYVGGSGADGATSIKQGADGQIIVTGYTASSDFPGIVPGYSLENTPHSFIVHLGPEGRLLQARVGGKARSGVPMQTALRQRMQAAPMSTPAIYAETIKDKTHGNITRLAQAPTPAAANGAPDIQVLPWLLQNVGTINVEMHWVEYEGPPACGGCTALYTSLFNVGKYSRIAQIISAVLTFGTGIASILGAAKAVGFYTGPATDGSSWLKHFNWSIEVRKPAALTDNPYFETPIDEEIVFGGPTL